MRQPKHSRASRNGRGIFEDLMRSAKDLLADTLLESLNEASHELLRRAITVTLLYVVAAVLLGTGAILLLVGGFEALRLIPLSDAAAYGIMGTISLIVGFAAVKSAGTRNHS
jgi:hypothetical protein